jgi:hypothetical protein
VRHAMLCSLRMHEPGVALTDFLLAVENAVFAFWLSRVAGANARLRLWFVVFFSAIAIGALLGGITHGYLPDAGTLPYQVAWRATMISVGLAGLGAWMSAAELRGCERARTVERLVGSVVFAAFVVVVLFISQDFKYAIVAYLPATVFLLFSFVGWWRRAHFPAGIFGAGGVLLTFVAAGVQQSSVSLQRTSMNNNVLYHGIQAVALGMVFAGARAAVRESQKVRGRVAVAPDR